MANCNAAKTTFCMRLPLLLSSPADMKQQVGDCNQYDLWGMQHDKRITLTLNKHFLVKIFKVLLTVWYRGEKYVYGHTREQSEPQYVHLH